MDPENDMKHFGFGNVKKKNTGNSNFKNARK